MLGNIAISLIKVYQRHIRIALPSCCRFTPSCSDYAKQAVLQYGFFKGTIKAIKRILSCHPFSGKSGYDPLE